jgi:hypothetical protein
MFNTIESEYLGDKNVDGFNKRELLGRCKWGQLKQKNSRIIKNIRNKFY